MRCPQCGFEAAQGAMFCSRCGTRLFAPKPAAIREYALLKVRPSLWYCANFFIVGLLVTAFGGRTLYVSKQEAMPPVLVQIRAELAQQYYLGYYVPHREGFHRLRVEIPGRNLRIRAKTGYRVN